MARPKVDKEWFKLQLERRDKSMRALARHMGIDIGALSLTFSGQRKMQLSEANAIASFLQAPVSEVLRHAGMSIDPQGLPTRILLAAIINENGKIERLKEPKPLPGAVIERAQAALTLHTAGFGTNGSMLAAQIRAMGGPLVVMDDAVLLFRHTKNVEPTASGVLSICRTHDGDQLLAKIEMARKTGESRLLLVNGDVKDLMLQTATPVLAIIP